VYFRTQYYGVLLAVVGGNWCAQVSGQVTLRDRLPVAVVGRPYSATALLSNGGGVCNSNAGRFSVVEGALPAGMRLSSAGYVSGVAAVAGSFPVTIRLSNSCGDIDRKVIMEAANPAVLQVPGTVVVGDDPVVVAVGTSRAGVPYTVELPDESGIVIRQRHGVAPDELEISAVADPKRVFDQPVEMWISSWQAEKPMRVSIAVRRPPKYVAEFHWVEEKPTPSSETAVPIALSWIMEAPIMETPIPTAAPLSWNVPTVEWVRESQQTPVRFVRSRFGNRNRNRVALPPRPVPVKPGAGKPAPVTTAHKTEAKATVAHATPTPAKVENKSASHAPATKTEVKAAASPHAAPASAKAVAKPAAHPVQTKTAPVVQTKAPASTASKPSPVGSAKH